MEAFTGDVLHGQIGIAFDFKDGVNIGNFDAAVLQAKKRLCFVTYSVRTIKPIQPGFAVAAPFFQNAKTWRLKAKINRLINSSTTTLRQCSKDSKGCFEWAVRRSLLHHTRPLLGRDERIGEPKQFRCPGFTRVRNQAPFRIPYCWNWIAVVRLDIQLLKSSVPIINAASRSELPVKGNCGRCHSKSYPAQLVGKPHSFFVILWINRNRLAHLTITINQTRIDATQFFQ